MKVLPRKECRLEAFIRYEDTIAMMCVGSCVIDPVRVTGGTTKAGTLIARLRDAMRGKRLFNYPSKKVPFGYDFHRIKMLETECGKIQALNTMQDLENKKEPDPVELVKNASGEWALPPEEIAKEKEKSQGYKKEIHVGPDKELVFRIAMDISITKWVDSNGPPPLYLVKYDTEEQKAWLLGLPELLIKEFGDKVVNVVQLLPLTNGKMEMS